MIYRDICVYKFWYIGICLHLYMLLFNFILLYSLDDCLCTCWKKGENFWTWNMFNSLHGFFSPNSRFSLNMFLFTSKLYLTTFLYFNSYTGLYILSKSRSTNDNQPLLFPRFFFYSADGRIIHWFTCNLPWLWQLRRDFRANCDFTKIWFEVDERPNAIALATNVHPKTLVVVRWPSVYTPYEEYLSI